MNEFVLSFPNNRGNSWQHYDTYFVDVIQGTVIRETTSHDNCMGIADRYEWQSGFDVVTTFRHRINPKIDTHHNGLALGRYISNGKMPVRYFIGASGCNESMVDVRFEPVKANYFTGGIVRGRIHGDSLEGAVWRICLRYCDRQSYYGGGYIFTAHDDINRLALISGLLGIFNQMSPSQVRFVARSYPHEPLVKSIRTQIHLMMNTFRTSGTKEAEDLINQLYPTGLDITPIDKSIKRRLRRIPNATAATKKFLTMMAASCSLKNLFTRLRKASLTNETK